MQLRITSGTVKNKKILAPDIPNFRAVQEVVKLAVFSIIGEKIEGAVCLDLFAGSGNMGLEALSRGAGWCDFVDSNWEAKQTILKNITNMGFTDKAEFHFGEAVKYVGNMDKKYDVIFVDPFYEDLSHKFLVKNLEEILQRNGVIIFMHGDKLDMEELIKATQLKVVTQRRFGKSYFDVLSLPSIL
jgi:16S rRNA (guanine(966)-N(2))-methyltransferase RsmD